MSPDAESFDTGLAPTEIDPEHPRPVETPWGTFALFRVGEALYCVEAFCPHMQGPLFAGSRSGRTITCPWHFWQFDLATGARLRAPLRPACERRPLERCAATVGSRGTLILRRLAAHEDLPGSA